MQLRTLRSIAVGLILISMTSCSVFEANRSPPPTATSECSWTTAYTPKEDGYVRGGKRFNDLTDEQWMKLKDDKVDILTRETAVWLSTHNDNVHDNCREKVE